jgi:hypothetical protein
MTARGGVANAARAGIVRLGGGFMTSREVREAGRAAGFRGWEFYTAGRCGPLGPVPADVVVAVLGFFPASTAAPAWERAFAVMSPLEAGRLYADACHSWGRRRLMGLADPEGLAGLLDRVVAAADPAGKPLFAAWRALPAPEDALARVAHQCQVLREHRGAAHLMAVLASGLTPFQAMLAGRGPAGGTANATFFGWPEPHPEVTDAMRAAWVRAEDLTNDLVEPAYRALAGEDWRRLVAGLDRALATAFPPKSP